MRIRTKIGRDFPLISFLLLVVIAGVLNTNLFRRDTITYHNGHGVIYPKELVLGSIPKVLSAVFFYDEIQNSNVVQKLGIIHCSYAYGCSGVLLESAEKAENNFRPSTSFCYSSLFNIPHQNSDEDNVLVSPVTAA